MDVIRRLAEQFPQLYLAPAQGVSKSEYYRNIVGKGLGATGDLRHFQGSVEDELIMEHTPVGDVMVVYLANRSDFERCYQILGCRCEPVAVAPSIGSFYISGINDWSRIHAHKADYLAQGGQDWPQEFSLFTANPDNYKASIILLSEGPYSGMEAMNTAYTEQQWLDISREIRKYHELTHFVYRKHCPGKRNAILEELLADCIGLVFATGEYDPQLAQAFLGIVDGKYQGGRLAQYVQQEPDAQLVQLVCNMTQTLAEQCKHAKESGTDGYALMLHLINQY